MPGKVFRAGRPEQQTAAALRCVVLHGIETLTNTNMIFQHACLKHRQFGVPENTSATICGSYTVLCAAQYYAACALGWNCACAALHFVRLAVGG